MLEMPSFSLGSQTAEHTDTFSLSQERERKKKRAGRGDQNNKKRPVLLALLLQ
jgi:hypothetical protein